MNEFSIMVSNDTNEVLWYGFKTETEHTQVQENCSLYDVEPEIIGELGIYEKYDAVAGKLYEKRKPPEPTAQEALLLKLAALQAENETLMLALAEQYEKQLTVEANQQTIMLALADIFEANTNAV